MNRPNRWLWAGQACGFKTAGNKRVESIAWRPLCGISRPFYLPPFCSSRWVHPQIILSIVNIYGTYREHWTERTPQEIRNAWGGKERTNKTAKHIYVQPLSGWSWVPRTCEAKEKGGIPKWHPPSSNRYKYSYPTITIVFHKRPTHLTDQCRKRQLDRLDEWQIK